MSDYSIWLTLEKDSRSKYRKIIMKLSKRLNSIPFDPHCTIYSRLNTDLEKVIPIINDVAKTRDQFSVKVKRLKTGKSKWKSLYLSIDNKEELQSLYSFCKRKIGTSRKFTFDPHLSFAYGLFNAESIHNATKDIVLPKYIAFSGISIVKTGGNISTWETIFHRQIG